MGFRQSIIISSSVEWEMKQTILSDALERWPFIRLPNRDFVLPKHAQFAPPELTDYLFANQKQYEKALERNWEVEDGLPEWSRNHPSVTFACVRADCVGGACVYDGYIVLSGTSIFEVSGDYAGHLELLAHVGLSLGSAFFAPFTRGYFEHGHA